MIATYTTTFVARCPVDDRLDIYDLTVTAEDQILPVEELLDAIGKVTDMSAYQEDLTQRLADLLPDGLVIQTVGMHSGVRTVVTQ